MSDNTMTYKGYTASIEYSNADGCFIGDVLGISAMISFEGASIEELQQDFHNAIESYFAFCRECNEEPERPRDFDVTLELPADIYSRITSAAEAAGYSTNDMIVEALEAAYPAPKVKVKTSRRKAASARPKSPAVTSKAKAKKHEPAGVK